MFKYKIMKAVIAVLIVCLPVLLFAGNQPVPPGQPASGPGGLRYKHADVRKHVYGEGIEEYWLFEPINPRPASAPVVVFNHGWGAVNPKVYGAWIDHIVRRGNIVIYPRYQKQWRNPPGEITANAIKAVKDAIKRLRDGTHIRPRLNDFAIVGHSAGGQISANMAALALSRGLPRPKAVMCVQPGKSWNRIARACIPLEDLRKVPAGTLLLAVTGDRDMTARDTDSKRIIKETVNVPLFNKNLINLVSDDHGKPALIANHFSPCAMDARYDSGEKTERQLDDDILMGSSYESPKFEEVFMPVNALDYYGYWKLFDGLCEAAFYGKEREYALGNTPEQKYMGKWSDDIPVQKMEVK
ncbi:MAG: hypothetical protein A3I43_05460 [Omnitrophica WOR_2 bacterium RIFCSPLOWO2_02_FULL_50_19]|nr:MAG: hypothetical protein A3I43_05460 [Omnitrophica WOR_2 bacterium RIFCSPLOWO2_02_FULL_50_19]